MTAGLGLSTSQAPLDDSEEETYGEFFVFLSMAPSEFYALPEPKREQLKGMFESWHLTHLYLTRMATKKQ